MVIKDTHTRLLFGKSGYTIIHMNADASYILHNSYFHSLLANACQVSSYLLVLRHIVMLSNYISFQWMHEAAGILILQ